MFCKHVLIYFSLFLKTEVFKMGMFHKLGYFGAHMQKPKEGNTMWDLKHMTQVPWHLKLT
jgi:hypothetical protein